MKQGGGEANNDMTVPPWHAASASEIQVSTRRVLLLITTLSILNGQVSLIEGYFHLEKGLGRAAHPTLRHDGLLGDWLRDHFRSALRTVLACTFESREDSQLKVRDEYLTLGAACSQWPEERVACDLPLPARQSNSDPFSTGRDTFECDPLGTYGAQH